MKTSKILSFDYLVNASDILIPVSDVISISLVENRLNFISRACRLLHTESFDTDEAAKTAFNTYARNFESNLPEEAVYRVITALPDLSSSTASACSRTQSGLS